MKKFTILVLLWILAYPLFAEDHLNVSGFVTDIATGTPVVNHEVVIEIDSSAGYYFHHVVFTDVNGHYSDVTSVNVAGHTGLVIISLHDCQQNLITYTYSFAPGSYSIVQNFTICSTTPACHADYTFLPAGPLTLQFTNLSIGPNTQRLWNFGDGTTSDMLNPLHTFPASGNYSVSLTIGSQGTTCWDQVTKMIYVGDSINNPCHAEFHTEPDLQVPYLVHFLNQSAGTISSFTWDFGDNVVTTIPFPGNPNVDHQYSQPGTYNACLTIQGFDTLCSSTFCKLVVVDSVTTQCHAEFSYYNEPGTTFNLIHFVNQSITASNAVVYHWEFGDGSSSTEPNPTHLYPAAGPVIVYNACLTITSNNTSCSSVVCHPVALLIPPACAAAFDVFPRTSPPNTKHFEDRSTGNIQSWTWEFGDGTTATISAPNNPNLSHTFPAPGFYTVCLFISGADSCSSHSCVTVAVGDSIQGCHSHFTYYPDTVNAVNTLHFVDLSTGNPTQWLWNFGDPAAGTNNTSTLQNPDFTYTAPGTYEVCLSISGNSCQDMWCAEVEVGAAPNCASYFTFSKIALSVNFEGHFINGTEGEYLWNFGDNSSGNGKNIVHNYAAPGMYFVSLTTAATAPAGCTFTSGQMISMGDSTPWHQVYGQVFAGNFPAGPGLVLLFSMDSTNVFAPFVGLSPIDSSGVYYFPMVPEGNFVVYAIPFTPGYMPTYYGDVLDWESATIISLGTPNNPYNIHLIQGDSYTAGSGAIQGQLVQGDISSALINKVTMLLKDEAGNTILYNQVTDAGTFTFPLLAYGTYYVRAELAGCSRTDIKVVLSENSPTANVSLALSGRSILGEPEAPSALAAGVVYPDPVREDASISLHLNSTTNLILELSNMAGQLVYRQQLPAATGENLVKIPAAGLANGIYTLKIYSRDGLIIARKLVKTK